MSITSEYPFWYFLLCIASGIAVAAVLYRGNRDFSLWIKWILAIARFAVITLLSFFLFSPLIKTVYEEIEKPIIILAQDNSESLQTAKDSVYYKNDYRKKIEELLTSLGNDYDIKTFSFGEGISENIPWDFSEKQTDISRLFDEVVTRFSNRNVGALLLASDGLYNLGSNPAYKSENLKFPVYTIAMGDTTVKRDLILKKVIYNRIAYLGNKFPLEILAEAHHLEGRTAQLKILKDNETVVAQPVPITTENFHLSLPLHLEAKQKGIQHYSVRLSVLPEESNAANNNFEVYIEVLDGRQKILVLAAAPHPDIKALRAAIESNDNYEAEVNYVNDFKAPDLKKYNLVILCQVPSVKNPSNQVLQQVQKEPIPVLYILGATSELNVFNSLQTGLSISGGRGKITESHSIVNKDFALFTLSPEIKNYLKHFPPLQTPMGSYKIAPSASSVLFQKIGMVETMNPLLLFNTGGEKKVGIVAGEGLWRWRLNDFAQHGNHNLFNEIILKSIQFLAVRENKNRFRVTGKNNFMENEPVVFDAELYNESYELVNDPEVNFEIINEEGKKFPFQFSRMDRSYHLDAGIFPVGNYRYEANAKLAETLMHGKGGFSVSPIQVELVSTVADHQLLYQLSKQTDGEMLFPHQVSELTSLLEARKDIRSISYSKQSLSDLINIRWIFFLLLAFISMEWFIRKRNGSY